MEYAIFTLITVGIAAILILNWLIYKPMFGKRHDRQDANPWQQYWGESYGPELKQRLLKPVFGKLETEEKIHRLPTGSQNGSRDAELKRVCGWLSAKVV